MEGKNKNTILNFILFTQLSNWSSYALLGKNIIYTQKYPFEKIGSFLKRNKTQVKIQDGVIYKRATIRVNGNGISLRDELDGREIGTKNQFHIKTDQFLLSKIDARNGAFGVVPPELNNGVITGNFWTFDVDYSKVNPHYLTLLMGTKRFQELSQTASVGTTNRNYLQEVAFLNFEIPFPTLEEQGRIVNDYNEKIERAKELEREAEELEKGIELRLFNILGIKKNQIQYRNSKINFTSFNFLSAWGVERLLRGGNKSILQSHIFENSKLSDQVLINPGTELSNLGTDEKMSFIPMECISDEYGEVLELREGTKSQSGGYTKFKEGDLIWARITPCMQNGKSAIVKGLQNGVGYGSTEFHVIRSKDDKVLLDYIYHILRLKTILNDATNYFTGTAGQQRVPKSYLEELIIPVPPIEVQRMISDELYSVKSQIKGLNKQALELRNNSQNEFESELFNN